MYHFDKILASHGHHVYTDHKLSTFFVCYMPPLMGASTITSEASVPLLLLLEECLLLWRWQLLLLLLPCTGQVTPSVCKHRIVMT